MLLLTGLAGCPVSACSLPDCTAGLAINTFMSEYSRLASQFVGAAMVSQRTLQQDVMPSGSGVSYEQAVILLEAVFDQVSPPQSYPSVLSIRTLRSPEMSIFLIAVRCGG